MKEPIRDRIAAAIARHLPKRVAYWSLIDIGVKNIEGNEVVPGVPFTVVLERFGKKMRGD